MKNIIHEYTPSGCSPITIKQEKEQPFVIEDISNKRNDRLRKSVKSNDVFISVQKKYMTLMFMYRSGLIEEDTQAVLINLFNQKDIKQLKTTLPWYSIIGNILIGRKYIEMPNCRSDRVKWFKSVVLKIKDKSL